MPRFAMACYKPMILGNRPDGDNGAYDGNNGSKASSSSASDDGYTSADSSPCNEQALSRNSRASKAPAWLTLVSACVAAGSLALSTQITGHPTVSDALKGGHGELWKEAMDEEVASLLEDRVWSLA